MSGDPYLFSGTGVLQNKFGIRDATTLDAIERQFVVQRASESVPEGNFDLDHLRAIHAHLFQDIYDWAGEVRTVEISKGGHQFQLRRYIATGMADIHGRLTKANMLRGLLSGAFCSEAARILGDVNYVHPFREGNGRTQLQYLKLLSRQAGHEIDLTRLKADIWLKASRGAHDSNYDAMAEAIAAALV